MIKRAICLCACLVMASSCVVASAGTVNYKVDNQVSNEAKNEEKEFTVVGKTYSYASAPKKVKKYHEKNCKVVHRMPQPDDKVFITLQDFDKYGINKYYRDKMSYYHVSYRPSSGIISVDGDACYSFDINRVYVGYGYTTSGNAVHCLQLLLGNYANNRGITPVAIDGIFGPNTRNLLLTFQSRVGIAADGIAGPTTWNTLVAIVMPD